MKDFLKATILVAFFSCMLFGCDMTNRRSFVCEDGTKLTIIDNKDETFTLKFKGTSINVTLFSDVLKHNIWYVGVENVNGASYSFNIWTPRKFDDMIKNGADENPDLNYISFEKNNMYIMGFIIR